MLFDEDSHVAADHPSRAGYTWMLVNHGCSDLGCFVISDSGYMWGSCQVSIHARSMDCNEKDDTILGQNLPFPSPHIKISILMVPNITKLIFLHAQQLHRQKRVPKRRHHSRNDTSASPGAIWNEPTTMAARVMSQDTVKKHHSILYTTLQETLKPQA